MILLTLLTITNDKFEFPFKAMDLSECSESQRIIGYEGEEEKSEGRSEKMEEKQALMNRVAGKMATMHNIFKERKIYVDVGKDILESFSTLEWALDNWVFLNGDSIVLLHIYALATSISTPLGKLRESEVGQDALDAFNKDEKARVDAILEKYIILCSKYKIEAEILKFERGEAHKSIVGLISELHMRKLVITRKMKLTGDKADYVRKHAPDLCKLYIISKGKLVDLKGHGDQGNQEALITSKIYGRIKGFEGIPETHVNISPYRDSEDIEKYFESLVEKNPAYNSMCESTSSVNNEASGVMEITSPEPHEFLDHSMGRFVDSETLKMRINQALQETIDAKNMVLSEVRKCKKAEWATQKSLEKANRYEDLYHKEIRQREETRELLRASRKQVLEISRQRDDAIEELEITRQSLTILGNLANEVSAKRDQASQELKNVVDNITKLKVQIFENQKEKDSTLRELRNHHNKECFYDDRDAIIHALQIEDEGDEDSHHTSEVPGFFMCPILQDVMQDPHVAADGFSYEFESIRLWIDSGHDTSPMTNLKLSHNILFPNYSLRSAIRHWQQRRIIFSSLASK